MYNKDIRGWIVPFRPARLLKIHSVEVLKMKRSMKSRKRPLSLALLSGLAVSVSLCCVSAGAAEQPSKVWGATSSGHSFSSEWVVTKDLTIDGVKVGEMQYGFDTDFINEDYCRCYFVDHQAQAAVSRSGEKEAEGTISYPSEWSSVSVHHTSDTVSYYARSFGAW